jgi:hypothetical protein
MFTAVKLSEISIVNDKLGMNAASKLCAKIAAMPFSRQFTYKVHDDGSVDIDSKTGSFEIAPFIKHNRLLVQFGEMNLHSGKLTLDNLFSLKGCPRKLLNASTLSVDSEYLHTLEGAPEELPFNCFIVAHNLKSLVGIPKKCTFMHIHSSELPSLVGIEGSYELLQLICRSVKNTDGLSKVSTDTIILPVNLDEITEFPIQAAIIRTPICKGLPNLLRTPGLERVVLIGVRDGDATSGKKIIEALNEVIEELESPKRRYLKAQDVLIAMGFDEFL